MTEERAWLGSYPEGVSTDIDASQYESLVGLMADSFAKYAKRTAYSFMGQDISYAQTDVKSQALAAYFQSLGLEKGDRVALMMPNVPQYPVAVAAILRAGLVVVNVNPLYTPRELEHQLKDSGAKAIVIIENFAVTLQKCIAETQIKHVVLCAMGDMLSAPKGALVNFAVRHVKNMVPDFDLAGAVKFNQAFNGLVCLASDLAKPRESSDKLAAGFARKYLETELKKRAHSSQETCYQVILALLPSGDCTATAVARLMNRDRRTLHRQLSANGLGFAELLDRVRMDAVNRHLKESDLSLQEISALLGFALPSSMNHWFQAKFGCSPSRWKLLERNR